MCSLLEPFFIACVKGQGGSSKFISQAIFDMSELLVFANEDEFDLYHYDKAEADDGEREIVDRDNLYSPSLKMIDVLKVCKHLVLSQKFLLLASACRCLCSKHAFAAIKTLGSSFN
jgi:hypothetical protein